MELEAAAAGASVSPQMGGQGVGKSAATGAGAEELKQPQRGLHGGHFRLMMPDLTLKRQRRKKVLPLSEEQPPPRAWRKTPAGEEEGREDEKGCERCDEEEARAGLSVSYMSQAGC